MLGAYVVECVRAIAAPYADERLSARLRLHRLVRRNIGDLERGPFRPTAPPRVPIDLRPEVVDELAAHVRARDDDEETDHREPDLGRRGDRAEAHDEGHEIEDERDEHEGGMDRAESLSLSLEIDVVGVTRERGEQHEHDPDADGRGRGGSLSG